MWSAGTLSRAALILGLIVLLASCADKGKDEGDEAAYGPLGVGEEAYVLPPLDEFVAFTPQITTDLTTKAQGAGFSLATLTHTKGARQQSVYAAFASPTLPGEERALVLGAFRVVGGNFADLARAVISLPGPDGARYFVAHGKRLKMWLGEGLKSGEVALTDDEFWEGLESEVELTAPPESDGLKVDATSN